MKISFLQIFELSDGTAHTIMSEVHQICDEFQLNLQTLRGLGSDGAYVMLGVCMCMVGFLLVANHCIAHRLSLAGIWSSCQ